jgi:rubredoxin
MLYQCKVCGYVYDESEGDPWNSIPPTPFDELKDWKCPICGNSKENFEKLE